MNGIASRYIQPKITICANCFHRDVCGDKDYLTENRCSNSVDESLCVILPCKVGDAVYFIREEYAGNSSVQSNEVFEIKLDSRGVVFYGVPRRCSMDFMCYIEDLGKTAFLTRAEAEAALKEVKQDG